MQLLRRVPAAALCYHQSAYGFRDGLDGIGQFPRLPPQTQLLRWEWAPDCRLLFFLFFYPFTVFSSCRWRTARKRSGCFDFQMRVFSCLWMTRASTATVAGFFSTYQGQWSWHPGPMYICSF